MLGWALLLSPAAPFAADGPNLVSARYVPPPVGTLVKYDDRSYKVVRTEGYLTVFETRKGGLQSWLYAYALFGETADDLYVSSRAPVSYDIDDKNKRMLEAFWPLRVGKSISFEVEEFGGGYAGAPQTWEITLRVLMPFMACVSPPATAYPLVWANRSLILGPLASPVRGAHVLAY